MGGGLVKWLSSTEKKGGLNSGFTVSYLPPTDIRASIVNNLQPFWAHFPAASSEHPPQGKRGPKMTGN